MHEEKRLRERFAERGKEMLTCRVSYPCFSEAGAEPVNLFYEELASACVGFCREKLFEKICGEYEADGDPGKKFHFAAYRYDAVFSVSHEDEEYKGVVCEVRMGRGNVSGNLRVRRFAQIWQCDGWTLVPPGEAFLRWQGEKRRFREPGALCLSAGKLLVLCDGMWKTPEKQKKSVEKVEKNYEQSKK